MSGLFPKTKRPYYIYTPGYTHTSSGVRTLHLLCHALNEAGEKAYIYPSHSDGGLLNPFLNTPPIDGNAVRFFLDEGIDPIAVYPDITRGNPIDAKHVVRYLLAPAGAYGGDSTFPETDMVWGALPSIAQDVLRLPVSDLSLFYDNRQARSGSCFYSHKYDRIHGQALLPITQNSARLEGSLEQIADTLRKSEVCYLYEVSSILTEAALCGCPVELVRTPYFSSIDPECMMGNVRWSDGEIVKETNNYRPEYLKIVDDFLLQLDNFIKRTQGAI